MGKLIFSTLIIVFFSFALVINAEEQDFESLSLDELMSVNLSRTGLVDVPYFHSKGEWMVSYKFHKMSMQDNRTETISLSTSDVLNSYMVSPLDMTMKMHMLGFMYGISDKVNIMGMLNYVDNSMNHITRMNMAFNTSAKKFGDTKIIALYNLGSNYNHQMFTTFGVSLPTGDINARGTTSMGSDQKLPYPMQLGSGTIDPQVALTYIGLRDNSSFGINASSIFRLQDNSNDYHLGNQYVINTWYSQVLNNSFTIFARSDGKVWGDVVGADPELNPMMVPTADPNLRGGTSLTIGGGVNYSLGNGSLNGLKLSLQYMIPYYQDLNGPQLENQNQINFGLILKR